MITRKSTFLLGIAIFLLPFIGIPTFWRTLFYVMIGITLAFSSVDLVFPKKLSRPKHRREKHTDVVIESVPIYPKDNIVPEEVIPVIETPKPERKRSPRKPKIVE